jgi:hypothetical protein
MKRARTLRWALLLLAVAVSPAWAQSQAGSGADSAAEIELWKAITARGLQSDYAGYLVLYPNGRFAPLARIRAGQPGGPSTPASPPVPAAVPAPAPAANGPAWVRPGSQRVRLVDGVVVDSEAMGLRTGSNHRLTVMPATMPDAVADQDAFLANSTPISTARQHQTIPVAVAGVDEVRLYYIPAYGSAFVVGARAPVVVEPGVSGAVLARALVREALRLGPVRFEAAHRDRPILVQAAFLRVRPRTEWNVRWFGDVPIQQVPQQVAVISIGLPGAAPDENGSLGEVVCVLPATTRAALDRIAAMEVGDPVLVSGIPYSWDDLGRSPLLLDRCSLQG